MNEKILKNKIESCFSNFNITEKFYNNEINNNNKYDDIDDYFNDHALDEVYGELPYGKFDYINYFFEDPYYPARLFKYKDNYIIYSSESNEILYGSLDQLNEYCKLCLLYNTLSNNYIPINDETYKMVEELADEKYDGKIYEGYDSSNLSDEIHSKYYQNQNKNKKR